MYSWGDTSVDDIGYTTLPDGRQVRLHAVGKVEGDTGAFCEDEKSTSYTWVESGEDLTLDELNSEIEVDGQKHFLHEYVWDNVKWDA